MRANTPNTGFHITDFCNPLHEPLQNPVPPRLDNLSSFILFFFCKFLYFPLKIEHAIHSVAILNKVVTIVSKLRVKCKLLQVQIRDLSQKKRKKPHLKTHNRSTETQFGWNFLKLQKCFTLSCLASSLQGSQCCVYKLIQVYLMLLYILSSFYLKRNFKYKSIIGCYFFKQNMSL